MRQELYSSASAKWHGLVLPMEKESQHWNKVTRRHKGCNFLNRGVECCGPPHEEKISTVERKKGAA